MRSPSNAPRLSVVLCWTIGCAAAVAPVVGCNPSSPIPPPLPSTFPLSPTDRLLILAPHPDDEILCCGGIIQQAMRAHVPVHIAIFTYGDNNQWSFFVYRKHPVVLPDAVRRMGLVRHDEAVAASNVLGLSPEHLTFLGYPDFSCLQIWKAHWGDRPPLQSLLTHAAAVPYANARRPGAPYKGEEILYDLISVLREVQPTKVFVSHPADHMPDHAALYLFTRVALWDLATEMHPDVYPYLVHFKRWPAPRKFRPTVPLEPPKQLKEGEVWRSYALRPEDIERKFRALTAHRTQMAYSAAYLLSFIRPNELFGDMTGSTSVGNSNEVTLCSGSITPGAETPEELTDVERAAFVGVETRSAKLEGDHLILSLGFSRPLGQAVEASVYAFGYRTDRPFAQMPKLHIKVSALDHDVFDQDRQLPDGTVTVSHSPKHLTVRIPLEALGRPQRVLTSGRTSLGEIPLDWVAWRILEVPAVGDRATH